MVLYNKNLNQGVIV